MIDAVQRAYRAVNCSVEVELLHRLIKEKNIEAGCLFPCFHQHSDTRIGTYDLVTEAVHKNAHVSRSAAEVEQDSLPGPV